MQAFTAIPFSPFCYNFFSLPPYRHAYKLILRVHYGWFITYLPLSYLSLCHSTSANFFSFLTILLSLCHSLWYLHTASVLFLLYVRLAECLLVRVVYTYTYTSDTVNTCSACAVVHASCSCVSLSSPIYTKSDLCAYYVHNVLTVRWMYMIKFVALNDAFF
jgi:hypothetical protein